MKRMNVNRIDGRGIRVVTSYTKDYIEELVESTKNNCAKQLVTIDMAVNVYNAILLMLLLPRFEANNPKSVILPLLFGLVSGLIVRMIGYNKMKNYYYKQFCTYRIRKELMEHFDQDELILASIDVCDKGSIVNISNKDKTKGFRIGIPKRLSCSLDTDNIVITTEDIFPVSIKKHMVA